MIHETGGFFGADPRFGGRLAEMDKGLNVLSSDLRECFVADMDAPLQQSFYLPSVRVEGSLAANVTFEKPRCYENILGLNGG